MKTFKILGIAALAAASTSADALDERHAVAVDKALANQLVDPTGVLSYRVAGLLPCSRLGLELSTKEQCVCFEFNSRNRMGGYSGKSVMYSVIALPETEHAMVMLPMDVERPSQIEACSAAGWEDRDGALILEQAR